MSEYTKNSFLANGLKAYNPPGALRELSEHLSCSQAITIPAGATLVVTTGQCGFGEDGKLVTGKREQIRQAFANAEKVLKVAGCKDGWKNVYAITHYYTSLDEEFTAALVEGQQKYLGTNRPAITGVAVAGLYKGAFFEMTLYASIPK